MNSAKIFSIFFIPILAFFLLPKPVYAAASLYTSPSSGTKYVGDKFNVFIYVNSPQATNSYEVRVSTSGINIIGLTTGGTICKLFPTEPIFTSSSAIFQCGLPTPGYTGSNGYIGSVIVQSSSPGTAKVAIANNSKVLANDGAGTNILGSSSTATFNIAPPPTSSPSISSSTHPDQDKWYKNTSPTFSWSGAGSEYSYSLDNSPDTTPDQKSEGSEKSKTFPGLTEGIWFFHVTVKGSGGWSSPSHYRVQVDTSPPEPFSVEASPKKDADKPPIISYAATDKISGIDHYEIRIDGGSWQKVGGAYQIERVSSGSHKVEVKAVDKAGNERISNVEFTVKDVPPPTITSPRNNSFLPYSETLTIKGTATPGSTVVIYVDGKKIATVKADKDGRFSFEYKELIKSGKHTLHATSVTTENIESKESTTIGFTIDPQALKISGFVIPGTALYIGFVTSLFLLVLLLLAFVFKSWKSRVKLKSAFDDLESQIKTDLSKAGVRKDTQTKIEKDVEETEKEVT